MKRRLGQIKFDFWFFTKLFVILGMCLFIVYPFYTILTKSVFSNKVEGLTLYNFIRFFSKPYYYQTLIRSLVVCSATVLASTIIGVPIAYVMTRYNVAGKQLLHILIIMSLMSPPFIGAYSWIILMGRNGLVAKLFALIGMKAPTIYGRGGIIFVFTLHLFPYIYLYTSGAMNSIDTSLEEAAENLGMSKLKRIWTITLPVILPSILAGCVMVFMTALADFGTPMLLGEGYTVLPVLVYNEYMSESAVNPYMASALSVIIVACSLLVLTFQKLVIDKRNYQMSSLRPPQETKLRGMKRVLVSLPIYIVIFLAFLPQIVVVCQSFVERSFSGVVTEEGQGRKPHRHPDHVPLRHSRLCSGYRPDRGLQPQAHHSGRHLRHYDHLLCGPETALYRPFRLRIPVPDGSLRGRSLHQSGCQPHEDFLHGDRPYDAPRRYVRRGAQLDHLHQ